jgi:hypothetical protein
MEWTKDEVLAAVVRAPSSWIFDRATIVGHEAQVVFHLTSGEPGRFAVVYSWNCSMKRPTTVVDESKTDAAGLSVPLAAPHMRP